ncbi:GGDEF domain-containing protein [Thalassomonas viridans]|uniref:diguanylate cyclase n=1 Tax=Thalassomonas viridans TaxID=137584 RepID=A0AAE9Z1Z9_9GAMM|nr:GGDEF domain-containing protein [Thalassomonas viridans]WDE04565.1 GGDEF domain-containing protein [Thalassomonas viridans]
MCIAIIFSVLFALLSSLGINQIGQQATNLDYGYGLLMLALLVALKKDHKRFPLILTAFLVISFLLSLSALVTVVFDEFRAIWFYQLILVAFMLGGQKSGVFFTLLSLLAIVCTHIFLAPFGTATLASIIVGLVVMALVLSAFSSQVNRYLHYIEKQNAELNYLANKDPLTEVLHSKDYCQLTKKYIERAQELNENLSILYAGLDNLERLKEKYGNQIHHQALQHIITIIKEHLHHNELLTRVGEEKICIILPERDAIAAQSFAINIRNAVRDRLFDYGKDKIPLTLSIGVAALNDSDEEIRSIQIRADKGLLKAKFCGGNEVKICHFFDELTTEKL